MTIILFLFLYSSAFFSSILIHYFCSYALIVNLFNSFLFTFSLPLLCTYSFTNLPLLVFFSLCSFTLFRLRLFFYLLLVVSASFLLFKVLVTSLVLFSSTHLFFSLRFSVFFCSLFSFVPRFCRYFIICWRCSFNIFFLDRN